MHQSTRMETPVQQVQKNDLTLTMQYLHIKMRLQNLHERLPTMCRTQKNMCQMSHSRLRGTLVSQNLRKRQNKTVKSPI